MRDALAERGLRHEADYLDSLREAELRIADIRDAACDGAEAATHAAMRAGVDIVAQGALSSGDWRGYPDILRRVERPSRLGAWSYEALDTKLSREAKAGAVLQLYLYSRWLGEFQGASPEFAYIVTPGQPFREIAFRLTDYGAYCRSIESELSQAVAAAPADTYPEPVEHCEMCRWRQACTQRRREDDHLSFVAGMGKRHMAEFVANGAPTLEALATAPLPFGWSPERGAVETYERLREQARVQLKSRMEGVPVYETLPLADEAGFALLPEPSPGDVFLDLEGDPFVSPAGREYLFGWVCADAGGALVYRGEWAPDAEAEKAAFEAFLDFIATRLRRWPDLHVYHYAPYEPAAMKRLMCRYATREQELDELLRRRRFIDLHRVVRQALRCGVESYSIKRLEPLYRFARDAALPEANRSLARVQAALELGGQLNAIDSDCEVVRRYNEDDCRSTAALRDWLETLRVDLVEAGADIPRPAYEDTPAPAATERDAAVAALAERLTAGIPAEAGERSPEQHGRWLLAQTLSWHRREDKATWWEYFRLADLSPEDLIDERAAVSGLVFQCALPADRRAVVHRYSFPQQETELRGGEELRAAGGVSIGTVNAIDADAGWIDIKKTGAAVHLHPAAVFGFTLIRTTVLADALFALGEHVADAGLMGCGNRAARDLLLRARPAGGGSAMLDGEAALEAAIRLLLGERPGLLAIQGPPGAGKTYTGAMTICALAGAGLRIGVTATSHKVIRHVLEESYKRAEQVGVRLECVHFSRPGEEPGGEAKVRGVTNRAEALKAAAEGSVVGGTPWFWANHAAAGAVDVLFVDEAAQMSLANVLAVSRAADSIVLLGDPRQLEQPQKASHPAGSDVSALHHLLGGALTMPNEAGLFLADTYRLHPDLCQFTSELFYEGRLRARSQLERQRIRAPGRLQGAGLVYVPVAHAGNTNAAREEVDAIASLYEELTSQAHFIDRHGVETPIGAEDVLIVAPFNVQVSDLRRRLPQARVGTVDKFQGQEAPVVIYSMTSSSAGDAPRGMEFLFSLNRLNVATSRAQALCVLVGSPALFQVECASPGQMLLANALCRYREMARVVTLD